MILKFQQIICKDLIQEKTFLRLSHEYITIHQVRPGVALCISKDFFFSVYTKTSLVCWYFSLYFFLYLWVPFKRYFSKKKKKKNFFPFFHQNIFRVLLFRSLLFIPAYQKRYLSKQCRFRIKMAHNHLSHHDVLFFFYFWLTKLFAILNVSKFSVVRVQFRSKIVVLQAFVTFQTVTLNTLPPQGPSTTLQRMFVKCH